MSKVQALCKQIEAVCPIDGVSIGQWADRATWRIDFRPEATAPQRASAQTAMDAFDPSLTYPTADQSEEICRTALSGDPAPVDLPKVLKAKMVSDLAFRLGVAPGALTAAQMLAERNRIAAIYKAL